MNVNIEFARSSIAVKKVAAQYDLLSKEEKQAQGEEYRSKLVELGMPEMNIDSSGKINVPNSGEIDEYFLTKYLFENKLPPSSMKQIGKIKKAVVETDEYKAHKEKVLKEAYDAAKKDKRNADKVGDSFESLDDAISKVGSGSKVITSIKAKLNSFKGDREKVVNAPSLDPKNLEVVQTGSMTVPVMDFKTGNKAKGSAGSSPYKADITLKDKEAGYEYRISVKSLAGGKPTFSAFYPDNMDKYIDSLGFGNIKEWGSFKADYREYQELLGITPEMKELKSSSNEKSRKRYKELKEDRLKNRAVASEKVLEFLHGNPVTESKIEFMSQMLCCVVQSGKLPASAATHMAIIYPSGGLNVLSVREYAEHLLHNRGSFIIDYSSKQGGNWRENLLPRNVGKINEATDEENPLPSWQIVGKDNAGSKPPSWQVPASMSGLADSNVPDDLPESDGNDDGLVKDKASLQDMYKSKPSPKYYSKFSGKIYWKDQDKWYSGKGDGTEDSVTDADLIANLEDLHEK
jgi:hypothetical protein